MHRVDIKNKTLSSYGIHQTDIPENIMWDI